MKKLLLLLFLVPVFASAQYDSTKVLQTISAYGYSWKNAEFKSSLKVPMDTLKLAIRDSGAIAVKGGKVWQYNGKYWTQTVATGVTDTAFILSVISDSIGLAIDTAYKLNDSTLVFHRTNGDTWSIAIGSSGSGGAGSIEYLLQGYGIKLDSTGRTYTVKADTLVVQKKLTAGSNISIAGDGTISASAGGVGTVTSVATNTGSGITGGTITSTGTLTIDTLNISTKSNVKKGLDSLAALKQNTLTAGTNISIVGNTINATAGTGVNSVVAGTNVTVDNTDPNNPIVSASGGGGSSNTVTEQKIYYRTEYHAKQQINTSTGAISSTDTTKAVSDYLHIFGNESVTISVPTGYSNITIYGWTYDTTLTAISEIRSNALIGTGLKTYTFTTPSNARFLNIYVKYGGIDFSKALQIRSTNTITYNTPITPEQFTGTKSAQIQAAINFARFTSTGVTLTGNYIVDSTLLLSSGSTLILNNARLTLDSGSHCNIIRNEATANPLSIFARGNKDVNIIGVGNAVIEGSKEDWGYGDTAPYSWSPVGVIFANVERFSITGITVTNTNMWGLCMEQSRIGLIDNITLKQDGGNPNQDGINIRRGSEKITVSNIKGYTQDDMIALTNLFSFAMPINVLGATIYKPYADSLIINGINIENVHRDSVGDLAGNIKKGGILILSTDGAPIRNVKINNISGYQQIQVQYAGYGTMSLGDVSDLNISNTGIAPVYFGAPVVNSSFINIPKTSIAGIASGVLDGSSLNVLRKYQNETEEFFPTVTITDNIPSSTGAYRYPIFRKDQNTATSLTVSNQSDAAGASSSIILQNNLSKKLNMGVYSSGFSQPDYGYIQSDTSLSIGTAAGDLRFGPANVLRGTWKQGGNLLIGTSTDDATNAVQVSGTVKADLFVGTNNSNGTMTLSATSNATKTTSKIVMQSGGGGVSIGTTSNDNKLNVDGGATATAGITVNGTSGPAYTISGGGTARGYWGTATAAAGFLTDAANGDVILRTASTKLLFGVGYSASTAAVTSTGLGVGTVSPTSALHTTAFATGYVAKTATYTIGATDNTIECTANTFTVTLPTAVGITGREYWITNTGSGTITLATTSSQTFVNVTATPTTLSIPQFTSYKVKSNGAVWIAFKMVN